MLWKALLIGLVAGAGLGGTLAAAAAGSFLAPEPPPIPGEPFSGAAQTQSTTVFADGNRIVRTNTVHYFRDGQGRTRVERPAPPQASTVRFTVKDGGNGGALGRVVAVDNHDNNIEIDDPVSGERIHLIAPMKIATVIKYTPGKPSQQLQMISAVRDAMSTSGLLGLGMGIEVDGRTTESSTEATSLGEKVVNGILATGTRTVRVIPAGALGNERPITSTLEEWKSAELGIPVQITETSSIGGRLTYNLQDVVRAEPDPSLFTVPAGYTRQDLGGAVAAAAGATPVATVTAVKKPH